MFKGIGAFAIVAIILNMAVLLGLAWGILALLRHYDVI